VVGEFPELQGLMGRYYALHDKEDAQVADAIRDHYKPVGPSDVVPKGEIALAVALADKLDQLVGFFAVNERPTGSGDPFALRRAALGVIRILLERGARASLKYFLLGLYEIRLKQWANRGQLAYELGEGESYPLKIDAEREGMGWIAVETVPIAAIATRKLDGDVTPLPTASALMRSLLEFFADRLKVALKEKGTRHDLIDAVFSLGHEDDLVRLVARVEALQAFLKSDDGANLLAGYKRAVNILKIEEKKDDKTFISEVSEKLLCEAAEKGLFAALSKARAAITAALEKEDFAAAMQQMAQLRVPVDGFFESVKVNAEDKKVRENRLNLLASLRATLHQVADFSKIEG
jgi:glycyl-tRNA synthetase beta chain